MLFSNAPGAVEGRRFHSRPNTCSNEKFKNHEHEIIIAVVSILARNEYINRKKKTVNAALDSTHVSLPTFQK